jgi:hypothetical protein
MTRHWLRDQVDLGRRRTVRLASNGLRLPDDLPRRPRQRGSVWGISIVKDEADVIELSVMHQLQQGLDAVLVADNGSRDGTREILARMARHHRVYVARDTWPVWNQAVKTTLLADAARRAGAEWIVPFDADEFWFARESSVADYLRSVPASFVHARVHNLFPFSDQPCLEPWTPFRFDLTAHGLRKVAFRSHRFASVSQGNHHAFRWGPRDDGLRIAHLPWRTRAQMKAKVATGSEALRQAGLPRYVSGHWVALDELSDFELEQRWQAILAGRPAPDSCWSPVGPFATAPVLSWATWDPDQMTAAR